MRLVSRDQLVLGDDRSFRFDHIFPQDSTQVHVHDICTVVGVQCSSTVVQEAAITGAVVH